MKGNGRAEKVAAVAYRIHTLLHTMRAIERHEEHLCGIMTEIRTTGAVTAKLDEELRDLLEAMPAHEYKDDIDAVRMSLSPEILSAGVKASAAKARNRTSGRAKQKV